METGSLYAGEALLRHALELRETSRDIQKNPIIEGTLHLQLANLLSARKAMWTRGSFGLPSAVQKSGFGGTP